MYKITTITICIITILSNTSNYLYSSNKNRNSKSNNIRVLYLGDSLSYGAFGKQIERGLKTFGLDVYLSVTGGGSPYYWLSSHPSVSSTIGYWEKTPRHEIRKKYIKRVPKIDELIKKYKPQIVVIQAGTNLYASLRSKRRSHRHNVKEVSSLVNELCKTVSKYNVLCYWILPPDSHPKKYPESLQKEMANIIKRSANKYGSFFDSRQYTQYTASYPKFDGIHYGPQEASKWARQVLHSFRNYIFSSKKLWTQDAKSINDEKSKHGSLKQLQAKIDEELNEDYDLTIKGFTTKQVSDQLLYASYPKKYQNKMVTVKKYKIEKEQNKITKIPTFINNQISEETRQRLHSQTVKGISSQNKIYLNDRSSIEKQNKIYKSYNIKKAFQLNDNIEDIKIDNNEEIIEKKGIHPKPRVQKVRKSFSPSQKPIEVFIKLIKKTKVTNLNEVIYEKAFAVYEYEVLKVERGKYPYDKIRVAHMIVMNRKFTGAVKHHIGKKFSIKLAPLDNYKRLKLIQIEDNLPSNFKLPIYIAYH